MSKKNNRKPKTRTKKRVTRASSHKKVVAKLKKELRTNERMMILEGQQKANAEIRRSEAQFLTNLLISVNAIADVIVKKGLISHEELAISRIEAVKEFETEQKKDQEIAAGELCICRCTGDQVCKCPCHKGEPCTDKNCKFCEPFREMLEEEEPSNKFEGPLVERCACGEALEDMDGVMVCPVCLEVPDEVDGSKEQAEAASAQV